MNTNSDKWIRIFDVSESSTHKKGFTIYKILSMLYPENCPDAITKIIVWKRFDDVKKLHRTIKILHKKLKLKEKFPILPKSSFFKRFDEEIIEQRRQSILIFLEYIGDHAQLFTCDEFVKFFESSHTPADQIQSNIGAIRADLNLPEGPEYGVMNSDEEPTISDTDSVTTLNSLACSSNSDMLSLDVGLASSRSKTSLFLRNSVDSMSLSTTSDSLILLDGQMFSNFPKDSENYAQYIIDASIHINIAVELENNTKYDDAFTAYTTAIDILLKYGKADTNYDRKQMVRYKIEKYLIRAEKIYNMHLAAEVRSIREITKNDESRLEEHYAQRPISDLYKYKVVRIIGSGMLVLHTEYQQFFYIKVVHKAVNFHNENLILPENVPYMIKLYNYFDCENALFLVLEYCSGKKLWDYIKHRSNNPDDVFYRNDDDNLRQLEELDVSEPESEHSYTDLINEYEIHRRKRSKSGGGDDFEHVFNDNGASGEPIRGETLPIQSNRIFERKFSELSSLDEVDVSNSEISAIPQPDVVRWMAQLLLALEKLHALGIICSDLNSQNLLINEDNDLILTYMCTINECHDVFNDNNNTKTMDLAPEMYGFKPLTKAVDWWRYGVILYELLVGMPLYVIHPNGLTYGMHLKIPKNVSPQGKSILKQLLVYESTERLGYGQNGIDNLKSHPFFSSVRWNDLMDKYNNLL